MFGDGVRKAAVAAVRKAAVAAAASALQRGEARIPLASPCGEPGSKEPGVPL